MQYMLAKIGFGVSKKYMECLSGSIIFFNYHQKTSQTKNIFTQQTGVSM